MGKEVLQFSSSGDEVVKLAARFFVIAIIVLFLILVLIDSYVSVNTGISI